MNVGPEKLRQWAAAERFAVIAEEMVRGAIKHHIDEGAPPPSADIMKIAKVRREEADKLFYEIFNDVSSAGPLTSGWERLIR